MAAEPGPAVDSFRRPGRPGPKDFAEFYADPVSVNGVAFTIEQLVARARALNAGLSDLRSEVLQVVEGDGAVEVMARSRWRS